MVYWLKNNWLLVCVIFGLLIFAVWELTQFYADNEENTSTEPVIISEIDVNQNDELLDENKTKKIVVKQFVDVKGAVIKPDVYEITGGERVKDLIEMAGGFTEKASVEHVNLAQKVTDEMVIIIPEIGNESEIALVEGTNEKKQKKLHINTATIEEIETLPGIGAVKAQAIFQYREENGPFKAINDLQNITGVGAKTVEKLKEFIQIP